MRAEGVTELDVATEVKTADDTDMLSATESVAVAEGLGVSNMEDVGDGDDDPTSARSCSTSAAVTLIPPTTVQLVTRELALRDGV
jgi:hypothetical protein